MYNICIRVKLYLSVALFHQVDPFGPLQVHVCYMELLESSSSILTWPGFKVYVKSYIKKVNCYEIYQKIRCNSCF